MVWRIGTRVSKNVVWRAKGWLPLLGLDQLCPIRSPGEGFVRPSLGFRCSKRILRSDNLSLF